MPICRKKDRLTFHNALNTRKCHPSSIHYPTTEVQIRAIVQYARANHKRVCVVGNASCENTISRENDDNVLLCLRDYNRIVNVDTSKKTVTAQAGCNILDHLIPQLKKHNLALKNLASDIGDKSTLGGLTGTASSLVDTIITFKVMDLTEKAAVHTIRRGDDAFDVFLSHLGVLAVVLEMTMELRDSFHLTAKSQHIGGIDKLVEQLKSPEDDVFDRKFVYFAADDEAIEVTRVEAPSSETLDTTETVFEAYEKELRAGRSSMLRKCCQMCCEPISSTRKKALLALDGTSTDWSQWISIPSLWKDNIARIATMEYVCKRDKFGEALKIIGGILEEKAENNPPIITIQLHSSSAGLISPLHSTSTKETFVTIDIQFHKAALNPRISYILQNELSKIGCRAHWGKLNSTSFEQIQHCQLWPESNVNQFLDTKSTYDPDNCLGCSFFRETCAGKIIMVENEVVDCIECIDEDECECNPIAIMSLPAQTVHKSGRIIHVDDGKVGDTIENVVAEC